MPSRNKNDLHKILSTAFDQAAIEFKVKYPNDPQPFLTCTYRSGEEQNILFKQIPKITNARSMESPHNYLPSLAFDIAFADGKVLKWDISLFRNFFDIIAQKEPLIEWGGSWKSISDLPHFQLINWKKLI